MVRRTTLAVVTIVLVTLAPGCSRGGHTGSGTAASAPSATVPFVPVDTNSTNPTDKAIGVAQARLRAVPTDSFAMIDLAQAFLQKARETADPTLYVKADGLIAEAARARPHAPDVLITQGSLDLSRHRFAAARTIGLEALQVAPGNESALGVLVDASNELGRYDDALRYTQQMVDIRPNLASLSRVSYARELHGDPQGAVTAMTQAVAAGAGAGENVAYVQVQLGILLLNTGDLPGAQAAFDAAQRNFPGFAAAKAGQARVFVAEGRYDEAAALLAQVVDVQPLSEYVIAEGDAYEAAGHPADAQKAYDLVDVIAKLYAANGVNVDLEMALFEADHHPDKAALARARKGFEDRPSVLGHDTVAWNLYRLGRLDDAWHEAEQGLALGTRDPQIRFHAAAIALARGDRVAASESMQIVLATNPRFSAHLLPLVRTTAAALDLPVPQ